MKKKISILFVFLITSLLLVACGESDEEKALTVAESFFAHYENNDAEKILEVISDDFRNTIGGGSNFTVEEFQEILDSEDISFNNVKLSVSDVTDELITIDYSFDISFNDYNDHETGKMYIINKEGNWLVDDIQ